MQKDLLNLKILLLKTELPHAKRSVKLKDPVVII